MTGRAVAVCTSTTGPRAEPARPPVVARPALVDGRRAVTFLTCWASRWSTRTARHPNVAAVVTIWHNPNCSTSKAALATAEELGADVEVRRYLKDSPSRDELLAVLGALEDEPSALVRRDRRFTELGLSDTDVATAEQVATVLAANPALIQRPVLIAGDEAIIGRPKDRVAPFLEAHPA